MTTPGTASRPLRVAVVGAGPAGFYTVEALLKHPELTVDIDLFERLPAPYGLLRYGVAPDHPKIKAISAAYERIGEHKEMRYLGNVGVGLGDIGVEELAACYDQVVFTTGCETDRRLGIPGEDLAGSHPATEFVAWYNGHPDHLALPVDLGVTRAVVVGIGDVALDLARILLRNPDELAATDIAAHALETLRHSRIREVVILARRGPHQAAFAAKELEDIGEIEGIDVMADLGLIKRDLAAVDPHSGHDRHKLEVLAGLVSRPPRPGARRLVIRFLASPVEITGDGTRATGLRIEENELVDDGRGGLSARGTGCIETLSAGLVLRSVGYLGVPLEGLPFDQRRGVVANVDGRVIRGEAPWPGVYAAGWIKRGASGVVGTNKNDAAHTVANMIEDLPSLPPRDFASVDRPVIDALLRGRGVRVVGWEGWKNIDRAEKERGKAAGKVREKFVAVDELLKAAGV